MLLSLSLDFFGFSVATKAAMTSGRLSGRPAAPIGQTSARNSASVPPVRANHRSKETRFVRDPIMPA